MKEYCDGGIGGLGFGGGSTSGLLRRSHHRLLSLRTRNNTSIKQICYLKLVNATECFHKSLQNVLKTCRFSELLLLWLLRRPACMRRRSCFFFQFHKKFAYVKTFEIYRFRIVNQFILTFFIFSTWRCFRTMIGGSGASGGGKATCVRFQNFKSFQNFETKTTFY